MVNQSRQSSKHLQKNSIHIHRYHANLPASIKQNMRVNPSVDSIDFKQSKHTIFTSKPIKFRTTL